jgi:hypothetical protein
LRPPPGVPVGPCPASQARPPRRVQIPRAGRGWPCPPPPPLEEDSMPALAPFCHCASGHGAQGGQARQALETTSFIVSADFPARTPRRCAPPVRPPGWTVGNLCGGCGVVVVGRMLYAAAVMASCSGSGGTQDQSRDC